MLPQHSPLLMGGTSAAGAGAAAGCRTLLEVLGDSFGDMGAASSSGRGVLQDLMLVQVWIPSSRGVK